MEISYWKARWNKGKTGWHMDKVYPHLPTYWPELQLEEGTCVLVPLCGKSLDLLWLKNRGHRVIGVDVSQKAAEHFFREHRLDCNTYEKASFTIFEGNNLSFWCGDFFKLQKKFLPKIDAIYDKAALIALPEEQRIAYSQQVLEMCYKHTQMLLNTFEYEQEEMNGPPFSVFREELKVHYGERFTIELLHEESVLENLARFRQRGLSSYLIEKVYHLSPKM
ncbi:MAG: thiopurine S-methyltransferase [Balneolaceae bacterium]|nr:thiopurine S-methyltransferase [Balneolaceae bacterium]